MKALATLFVLTVCTLSASDDAEICDKTNPNCKVCQRKRDELAMQAAEKKQREDIRAKLI